MGDLQVAPNELRARRGDELIELSLWDVAILRILHEGGGRVVARHRLFERVWGLDHVPNGRTLGLHVGQLRKRLEVDPRAPPGFLAVRGVG